MISVKTLADTYNLDTGDRLTTLELVYPRVVHSEFMTHRTFSRNAGSSRAKPIKTVIKEVEENPYIPRAFGLAQKGMQPKEFIYKDETDIDRWNEYQDYVEWWCGSLDQALEMAKKGAALGLHKQVVNRLLEPFQHISVVCTATDWDNFINLRTELDENGNPMADIPIYDLAVEVRDELDTHQPEQVHYGYWHVPYAGGEGWDDLSPQDQLRASIARCARVSYRTYQGGIDVDKDLALYYSLAKNNHLSPLEHVACATEDARFANLSGFKSFRGFYEDGRIN